MIQTNKGNGEGGGGEKGKEGREEGEKREREGVRLGSQYTYRSRVPCPVTEALQRAYFLATNAKGSGG